MRLPILLLAAMGTLAAQNPQIAVPPPSAAPAGSIAERTRGMLAIPGYFPLYYDAKGGRLLLEIVRWNVEFLYVDSLPAGVGSNDIGLDRGQLGGTRVVR